MGRISVMLALAAVLVLVAAGTALGFQAACQSNPCTGSNQKDLLYERVGAVNDRIYGLKGGDLIDANTFNGDRDKVHGQDGRDRLLSNDGDRRDEVYGGRGRDTCIVDRGDKRSSCEVVRITRTVGKSDVRGDLSAAAFE